MKKYRFFTEMVFHSWLLNMRDIKMKMTPLRSPRRADAEHALFDVERSISKSGLTACQVKVRLWRKKVNMHIFRSGLITQVNWHHLHVSISTLSRVIGELLHPDHHRWSGWSWSWKNWVASVSLCETGSIFIFPHRFRYKREVTKLTWLWVTRIKIPRYTFYSYLWPRAIL